MGANPNADPFARFRFVGTAAALLILLLGAKEVGQNFANPSCRDFINFWSATRFALAGTPGLAYDPQSLHHLESTVAAFGPGQQMPFAYMPSFLLLVLPFGLFSYPVGMALWVGLGLAAYFAALKRLFPGAGLLAVAFPPVLVTIAVGQNGLLTAALFAATLVNLDRRPFVAGLFAGCLILKPQLGLLFPLALFASGQWRAMAGAIFSAAGVSLFGLLAFGITPWFAWIQELPLITSVTRDGLVGWAKLTSVYAAARQAGLGATPAMALHLLILLAAAALVWKAWRKWPDRAARASVLASATALASPYLFLYDLPILIVPLLWHARTKTHPALVALPWCLSLLAIVQNFGEVGSINLSPAIAISLLAITIWKQRQNDTEAAPIAEGMAVTQPA